MIISFCGHSDYTEKFSDEKKTIEILERKVRGTDVFFYLGGYGGFDNFAYNCAKKFKEKHGNARLFFITPYLISEKSDNRFCALSEKFDLVLYPELERVPRKYAISYRNRWIVEQSDIIIGYIIRKYGGAYNSYLYAMKKGKEIYNIADI